MRTHRSAVAGLVMLLLLASPAFADQKIKTKSNIKNDRVAASCSQDCAAAGQKWAADNRIADTQACDSPSPEFTTGCRAYVAQQQAAPASRTSD